MHGATIKIIDTVCLFLSLLACLIVCLFVWVLAGISVRRIVIGFYGQRNIHLQ